MIEDNEIIELKILQTLESEDKWWQSEEIANRLNLSKATVQKYLNLLKDKISTYPKKIIYLETSTSKGVYFFRSPGFNLQIIYTEILKGLLICSVIDGFLYSDTMSVTQFSMYHFVSVASIRRKYKILKDYLKELKIDIKKDQLVGDERQIRWFLSNFYWEIYQGIEWPFPTVKKYYIETVLYEIESTFKMKMVAEMKEQITYWLAINIIRHVQGYRVPVDAEIEKYVQENPLFMEFEEVLSKIFKNEINELNESWNTNVGELQYVFFLSNVFPVIEKYEKINQVVYEAHSTSQTLMLQSAKAWIELYEDLFEPILPIEKRDRIEKKLLRFHCYSYLYKLGESIYVKEDYVTELYKYNPQFHKKMNQLYQKIEKQYGSVIQNKTFLMNSYALLALEELQIDLHEKEFRVALNVVEGIVYENIIATKLKAYFTGKYKLKFVNHDAEKDIIITNLANQNYENDVFIVSVNARLTSRDYENIEIGLLKTLE